MEQKKSLLERYGIPLNHLDFKYVNDCQDAREMEKIVHILRSGEEGYYPDLTKCAEEKLRELKPQSRLFRLEEQIKGREALDSQEWKPIYDWNLDIKDKDQQLQKLKELQMALDSQHPPIRKVGRILQDKKDELPSSVTTNKCLDLNKSEKSKSITDYRKWDKYDADEELLRMELTEERIQEEVERKNRLNSRKCKSPPKIEEILNEDLKEMNKLGNLADIEKEQLSEEFRLRGNEYFRAKELDQALAEYTRAIQVYPAKAVAAYNNRALTYFKQQKFYEAISDCENCLKLEPTNLKGRLRLAEANYAYGRRRESYQLYVNVLEVDPSNAVALKAITELRKMFEDLPPPNATRLNITDTSSKCTVASANRVTTGPATTETLNKTTAITTASAVKTKNLSKSCINYDLAELVKPNRLVKNKLLKAAENFGKLQTKTLEQSNKVNNEKKNIAWNHHHQARSDASDVMSELCMPGKFNDKSARDKKLLIEEI